MLLVAIGGAIGSCSRYCIGNWLSPFATAIQIPLATTLVNVFGSLVLGYVAGSVNDRTQWGYLLLGVGFCGGFTTFSTFSLELVEQLQRGNVANALIECVINVVLGVTALYAGLWLCKPG
jgi:CrcB protein